MSKLTNKIEANDRTVHAVLNEQKYTVDYFQREYSWGQKHIEQLITDLTSSFLAEYSPGDIREKGTDYNNYYLGPFVVSERDGKRSIIDGQQRLTSLTLFLIFLNHHQKSLDISENIEKMIFSDLRGSRSFNIEVEERTVCLERLFSEGSYDVQENDDESTVNMAERYTDISAAFPVDSFGAEALLFFIDWLRYNVVLVEIIAYSDDNAYVIFETMNDRGLNLTSTEMLKGYILSRFHDNGTREKTNALWKNAIKVLRDYDKEEDQRFFQAWLRAQYAETIRSSKAGSKNEDFEKIGTRFHSWVRENLAKMDLAKGKADGFEELVNKKLVFYLKAYNKIKQAEASLNENLDHVYYIKHWGIATSLSYPLMLAPLDIADDNTIVNAKLNMVAKYIETFTVKRSVNFRTFGASSIRYTMYTLVKEIRGMEFEALEKLLHDRLAEMDETWDAMHKFYMHGQNGIFVKFLLSRITAFIEQEAGISSSFSDYYLKAKGVKPFEIEHLIANKFERHRDEFEQETDFSRHRNTIGGLVLIPRGTNQSYSDLPYSKKVSHYYGENLLAQSLWPKTYEKNPNFLKMSNELTLDFKPHLEFKKPDMIARTKLYQRICEKIWA